MTTERDELISKMADFVRSIGLTVRLEPIETPTQLPGLTVQQGTLIIDTEKLTYPGDILHEAGHLAVVRPSRRAGLTHPIPSSDEMAAAEMMSITWSYAACIHLGIDPHIVFHEGGYRGSGRQLVQKFRFGEILAIPMLEWHELTFGPASAAARGVPPFPHMVNWVCAVEAA